MSVYIDEFPTKQHSLENGFTCVIFHMMVCFVLLINKDELLISSCAEKEKKIEGGGVPEFSITFFFK